MSPEIRDQESVVSISEAAEAVKVEPEADLNIRSLHPLTHLHGFPGEVQTAIFDYLTPVSFAMLSQTDRRFHEQLRATLERCRPIVDLRTGASSLPRDLCASDVRDLATLTFIYGAKEPPQLEQSLPELSVLYLGVQSLRQAAGDHAPFFPDRHLRYVSSEITITDGPITTRPYLQYDDQSHPVDTDHFIQLISSKGEEADTDLAIPYTSDTREGNLGYIFMSKESLYGHAEAISRILGYRVLTDEHYTRGTDTYALKIGRPEDALSPKEVKSLWERIEKLAIDRLTEYSGFPFDGPGDIEWSVKAAMERSEIVSVQRGHPTACGVALAEHDRVRKYVDA